MNSFLISGKKVGQNEPCFIIAEIGQAHDGSLGMAKAYIDAVAGTGADAVKFQTHIAEEESSPQEPFRVRLGGQDATRFDYWRRMEFSQEQWEDLAGHARDRGLVFLSSPFSERAADILLAAGVGAWKIASGELNNIPLFEKLAGSGLPVLLSTGMSYLAEVDEAVNNIRGLGAPLLIFQSTTAYPSPPELVGLNLIDFFRTRYKCPVGLSDHSGTIYPGLAAVALGIEMLEVHVTLSREMFHPDGPASLVTGELKNLVDGVRFIEEVVRNPVDKDSLVGKLDSKRKAFMKSLFARRPIPAGHAIEREDIVPKKPWIGLSVSEYRRVLGARARRDISPGAVITEDDIDFGD